MNKEKNPQTLWDNLKAFFSEHTDEEEVVVEAEMADEPVVVEVEDEIDYEAENEMLKAKVAELEAKLADIEAMKVEDETKLETMKAEKESIAKAFETFKAEKPATTPIKDMPKEVKKSYGEMTNFERMKFNKNNK